MCVGVDFLCCYLSIDPHSIFLPHSYSSIAFFSNLSNFPLLSLQFFSFGLPSLLFLIKFPLDWSDDNLVDFRLMLMLLLWRGKRNTETEREKRRKN